MTQHDREQLVVALLDITLGDFLDKLESLNSDEMDAIPEDVNEYAGNYVTHMRAADLGEPHAPQLMMQTIATMSDDTLHQVVQMFGKDPL